MTEVVVFRLGARTNENRLTAATGDGALRVGVNVGGPVTERQTASRSTGNR